MKLEFFFLRFYVIHEEYPLVCLITFLLYLRIQDKPAAVNPIDYHPSIKMFDDSIEHRCLDLIRIEDYIRAYLKILGVIFRMANVYFKEKKKKQVTSLHFAGSTPFFLNLSLSSKQNVSVSTIHRVQFTKDEYIMYV